MANTTSKTASPFSIVVPEGFAFKPFKVGELLTETTSVGRFLKHHAVDTAPSESVRDGIKRASNEEICEAANVTVPDDADEMEVRLNAIFAARFAVDTSNIPTLEKIRAKTETVSSLAFGDMVDDEMVAYLDASVAAIRAGKAMPVGMMQHFHRLFDNAKMKSGLLFWDECPLMDTQYIPGKKGNHAPFGYRLPDDVSKEKSNLPVFHGPYRIFQTKSGDTEDWLKMFVARKIAPGMAARITHLRNAKAGTAAKDEPADIKDMRERKSALEIDGAIDDAAFEFNTRVRAVGQAITLCQGARAIEARWPNVTVELAGKWLPTPKTDAECERMLKPFVFVTHTEKVEKDKKTGKEITVRVPRPSPAYGIATVQKAIARMNDPEFTKHEPKAMLAHLIDLKKKKTDAAKAQATGKTEPGKVAAHVETIDQFTMLTYELCSYVKTQDKTTLILQRCRDPKEGPEFCAALVQLRDALVEVCAAEGVRDKADAWELLQQKADAANIKAQAADKAKAS